MPHQQVRLHLPHGVEHDTDQNQHARAAKERRNVPRNLHFASEQDWDEVMDVNCKGVFLCCQHAAQLMIPQQRGRIINAASGQARQARAFTPHYAASKAGVVAITQSLALELAPFGISVNAYCPGVISTEMWKYNDREWGRLLGGYGPGDYFKEAVSRIPLGRPGSPQDVAGLVAFLASDDASYITGQAIHVNGGSIMAS